MWGSDTYYSVDVGASRWLGDTCRCDSYNVCRCVTISYCERAFTYLARDLPPLRVIGVFLPIDRLLTACYPPGRPKQEQSRSCRRDDTEAKDADTGSEQSPVNARKQLGNSVNPHDELPSYGCSSDGARQEIGEPLRCWLDNQALW